MSSGDTTHDSMDPAQTSTVADHTLDPRTLRFRHALTGWPRRRVQLLELWRIFDDTDPATRLAPNRRQLLLNTLKQLAAIGALELPASTSWDRIEHPHLPRFVTLPKAQEPTGIERSTVWHPTLAWVPDTKVPSAHRTDLKTINRWLHSHGQTSDLVVPLRERSLEIFGHEKTLDRLIRTSLFASDRLTLTLLRTRRAAPRFTHETVGDGTTLLIVENSDTFDSLTHALTDNPGHVGVIGWGSGGGFEASVLSIPRLRQTVTRVVYFGDLDLRGLQIPASASRTAHDAGLPPVEPATSLYTALLDVGRPQTTTRISETTASDATAWLPAHLRQPVHDLLTAGQRLAQEHIGAQHLADYPACLHAL